MAKTIKVLYIEAGKKPVVKEVEDKLENWQSLVGGFIELVYPYYDNVGLICDDEGKIKGSPLNRAMYASDYNDILNKSGGIVDIMAGNFVVVGLSNDGNFKSLTKKQIERYTARFLMPEVFFKSGDSIVAIEVDNVLNPDGSSLTKGVVNG